MRVYRCKGFFDIYSLKLIENCFLLIENQNIKILNKKPSEIKKCANLNYIIPPFFDTHVHLFLSGINNLEKRKKELNSGFEDKLLIAEKNLEKMLSYGIIGARDAGDNDWVALNLAKKRSEFLIIYSGKALFKKGRYGSFIGLPVNDFTSLKQALNTLLQKEIKVLKIINSGINSIEKFGEISEPQFTNYELEFIVNFAKRNNLKIMVHANGEKAISQLSSFDVSSIEHAFFLGQDNISRLIDKNIVLVPTFRAMYNLIYKQDLTQNEKDIIKRTVDYHIEEIINFYKRGGELAIGSDAGSYAVFHGEGFFQEIDFFHKYLGFSFEKILEIICKKNFELAGIENPLKTFLELPKFDIKELLNKNFKIVNLV